MAPQTHIPIVDGPTPAADSLAILLQSVETASVTLEFHRFDVKD